MNHILVGFRDLARPGATALGLFHTESGRLRPLLEWPDDASGRGGVKGLSASDRYLFVAMERQGPAFAPSVLVFDSQRFRLLGVDLLTGLSDIRSLLYMEGSLYIVSAGTEEVIAYRADQGRLTGKPFVWKPETRPGKHGRHEIHSLVEYKGELVVSLRLEHQDKGFLMSMTRGEPIPFGEDISGAGRIALANDDLISCEAETGTLRRLQDGYHRTLNKGHRPLGCCALDSDLFVGSKNETGCGIHRLSSADFRELEYFPISQGHGTISALLPVDAVGLWPVEPDRSWFQIPGKPVSPPEPTDGSKSRSG